MKTIYKAAILLMCLPIILGTVTLAQPPSYDLEKEKSMWADEHWRKLVIGPEAQMAEMLAHKVDAGGPPSGKDIPILQKAGWTMSATGGFSHYWYSINMRKPPLNNFYFRKAIAQAINKDVIYPSIYGVTLEVIYSWVPPAQAWWENVTATNEFRTETSFNLQYAINTLLAGGFTPVLKGGGGAVPDNIDHWHMPGTTTDIRQIQQNVHIVGLGLQVSQWIATDLARIGLSNIVHTPRHFDDIVAAWLTPPYLDWDTVIGIGLTFGKEPVLYEMFHVDSIPFANIWGLNNTYVNQECDAYRATLSETEARTHAQNVQGALNKIIPLVPVVSGRSFTCVTQPYMEAGVEQPGVLRWVNWPGFGGMNDYSRLYSGREDANSDPYKLQKWIIGLDAYKLNPLTSNTAYEWALMGRVYSGLLDQYPYASEYRALMCTVKPSLENGGLQLWNGTHRTTGTTMPPESRTWILDDVVNPTVVPLKGEYMRYTLRNDLTWHDGHPINAYDVEFCLDLLVKQNNERYVSIQKYIHDVVVIDDYTFDVWFKARYLWAYVDIAGVSLFCPKHIWGPYIDPDYLSTPLPAHTVVWDGDERDHRLWSGHDKTSEYGYTAPTLYPPDVPASSGPQQLTLLQGNGYCIYPSGGWVAGSHMQLIRWNATSSGWPFRRILRGDNTFDGRVNLLDLWAPFYAFGSKPGMPTWEFQSAGLKADLANPAALIDGRDVSKVYDDWAKTWYPTSNV